MRNNFPEILSLEDSDFLDHRRSKSSSQNNTSIDTKKRYLLEKRNHNLFEEESTPVKNKAIEILDLSSHCNTSNDKFQNFTQNTKTTNQKINKKVESSQVQTDYENSFELSIHSYKIKNNNLDNKIDYDKYNELKQKYIDLKGKHSNSKNAEKNWRGSYFNLLKDSVCYDETIKNLIEENRIHQEYIINLENKLNKLLTSCNNITSNFHNSLAKNINIDGENNLSNLFVRNYNEVLNDYKKQLEILADEKESLHTNLSISRHQQLQCTLKLEDSQTRLYNLEQARLEDLKILDKMNK